MSFGNGTVQTFAMNDRLQMTGQELKRGSETLREISTRQKTTGSLGGSKAISVPFYSRSNCLPLLSRMP
jgi:hypothetical protein